MTCEKDEDKSRSAKHKRPGSAVVVQDVLLDRLVLQGTQKGSLTHHHDDEDDGGDGDDESDAVAEALFELANAPEIGYRVRNDERRESDDGDNGDKDDDDDSILYIHQDVSACGRHTGGIVWETCFLLLEYLAAAAAAAAARGTHTGIRRDSGDNGCFLGRVLEVGAGCGLLGQILAARRQCRSVVLTETADVLPNVRANLTRNLPTLQRIRGVGQVQCCCLDWTESESEQRRREPELLSSTFDTIVGTDVIFAPHLVAPLLDTLRRFSHPTTGVYLCVQVRCPTSHRMFLDQAPGRGFILEDLTCELPLYPSCAWGMMLECHLYLLTRS